MIAHDIALNGCLVTVQITCEVCVCVCLWKIYDVMTTLALCRQGKSYQDKLSTAIYCVS